MAKKKPMTKHTPGSWAIGEDGDVYADRGAACVARIVGAPDGITEAQANARLISAAPDLLEAARDALALLREMRRREEEDWYDMPSPTEDALDLAIRKAEGRE